jgi:hypothetical protein
VKSMHAGRGIGPRRVGSVVLLAVGVALVVSCGGPAQQESTPADREAAKAQIQGDLETFLPRLADAYRTGEVERIRGYGVEKVMAQVEKRIRDLQVQGMVLEPRFDSLTIEELVLWGHDSAIVTTLEVWDLRYYSTGSHTLVSEDVGAKSRVEYQLKREKGRWLVFHRELKQELGE